MTRRLRLAVLAALSVALVAPLGAPAAAARSGPERFPTSFALPDGFMPEGITIGYGPFAYFGSRRDGSIYRVDLATGRGKTVSPGVDSPSIGLKIDRRGRLFVAGGPGGDGRVIDARSGRLLARYAFTTGDTFVNDVVLAFGAAWFTDSRQPALYKLPIGRDGSLPPATGFVRVPLSGDIVWTAGNNSNGISTTPDGKSLLIVQSSTGKLFTVNPRTGVTKTVDLGTEVMTNGDGLLREGRTLYVVQNRLNTVAVLRLARDGSSARVVTRLTDPRFDVPTTVASYRNRLYLPNARFSTPPTPTTPYSAVAIRKP